MIPQNYDIVVLLPRLRVQNANSISGPITWGFPAPSAFTGFVHALERSLNSQDPNGLTFGGVGIVCHQFEPQTHRPPGRYTNVFGLTRNPLDKDGNTPAIVEEGRTHFEVSLVITVSSSSLFTEEFLRDKSAKAAWAARVLRQAEGMRLAGGSIIPHPKRHKHPAQWFDWTGSEQDQGAEFARLRRLLIPGFALLGRDQLLADHFAQMQQADAQATALDALLDLCAVHHTPPSLQQSDDSSVDAPDHTQLLGQEWTVSRRKSGWLVPLPVGYASVSRLYGPSEVKNARDSAVPFRFVESILSLGEWVGPHRVKMLNELLWTHAYKPEQGLYSTHNGSPVNASESAAPIV